DSGTWAKALNNRGQVVGGAPSDEIGYATSLDVVYRTYLLHAFRWDPDVPNGTTGRITDLGTLRGGDNTSIANGLNDTGQVVGVSYPVDRQGQPGRSTAFLFSGSRIHSLGLKDCTESYAFAVNNAGQVVGQCFHSSVDTRAFRWENGK